MPGIPFLDNNTSYELARFLDTFIKAGLPIFSILSAGILAADFRKWRPKSLLSNAVKWVIHFFVFGVTLFCVTYGISGRYTETELGEYGKTDYYYFGQAKNQVRFGFGKLFRGDRTIWVISDAKGNRSYNNLKQYDVDKDGNTYLSFEGSFVEGNAEGFGRQYININGVSHVSYEGTFHLGKHDGEGTEYYYYTSNSKLSSIYKGQYLDGLFNGDGTQFVFDLNGNMTYYYDGGWAAGNQCGYGIELMFQNEVVTHAYRGTFWNGKYWGDGVCEYLNSDGEGIIWVGNSYDDGQTEDGSYYNTKGEYLSSEKNKTLVWLNDGTAARDEDMIEQQMQKWPLPDRIMLGSKVSDLEILGIH